MERQALKRDFEKKSEEVAQESAASAEVLEAAKAVMEAQVEAQEAATNNDKQRTDRWPRPDAKGAGHMAT